jgi:hypothetical protein
VNGLLIFFVLLNFICAGLNVASGEDGAALLNVGGALLCAIALAIALSDRK